MRLLADLLTDYWGMPPLVLLDEYDSPIHVAYDKGYYDRMIGFMRNFMSLVFKDNTNIFSRSHYRDSQGEQRVDIQRIE